MIRKTLIIMLITVSVNLVEAQTNNKHSLAVTNAVAAFTKAIIDADSITLDKLTSNELSYGHSGGQLQDKAAFIHSITSGASDFVTIDLTDQTIQLFRNTAI